MYDFPENGTEKKNKRMKRKENWRKIPSHSCDCYFFPPFFFISILLNVTKKMLSVCHTLIKPFSRIILFSFSFVFFFIYSPRCCCCFSGKLMFRIIIRISSNIHENFVGGKKEWILSYEDFFLLCYENCIVKNWKRIIYIIS